GATSVGATDMSPAKSGLRGARTTRELSHGLHHASGIRHFLIETPRILQLHALDSTCPRHHLHGERRQPAIRLDAVRVADPRSVGMEQGRNLGGLLDLHSARNLAGAV